MQRQVAPVATVGYNIYQNSTSIEWGNAGCGTFPGGTLQINNGNPVRSTIQTLRGVMPSGQLVPAGVYLETLVLTVTLLGRRPTDVGGRPRLFHSERFDP